jgi:hypothetical protein
MVSANFRHYISMPILTCYLATGTVLIYDWDGEKRYLEILEKPAGTAGRGGFDLQLEMKLKSVGEEDKDVVQAKTAFYNQIEVSCQPSTYTPHIIAHQRTVKDLTLKSDLDPMDDWRHTDATQLGVLVTLVCILLDRFALRA